MCAQHLQCEGIGDASSIEQMCAALGRHYGNDVASAIEASRSVDVEKDACDDIVNDPVTEANFEDLDADDFSFAKEFKAIGEAYKTRIAQIEQGRSGWTNQGAAPAKRIRTKQGGKSNAAGSSVGGWTNQGAAPAKRRRTNQGGESNAAGSSAGGSAGVVAGAGAEHCPRAGAILPNLEWQYVYCDKCFDLAGQIKKQDSPGLRDVPCWHLRVWDPTNGKWGVRSPHKQTFLVNDERTYEWAKQKVRMMRTCCED